MNTTTSLAVRIGITLYTFLVVALGLLAIDQSFSKGETIIVDVVKKDLAISQPLNFADPFVIVARDSIQYKAFVSLDYYNSINEGDLVLLRTETGLITGRTITQVLLDIPFSYPVDVLSPHEAKTPIAGE